MAQTSDFFLTDIDIKNLDFCEDKDICQYQDNDFNGVLSCGLQQLLNTPCDSALALGEVPGGSITNKKKKSSKKGGAPLVKWTTSLSKTYQAKKGTKASLLTIDEKREMLWFYKNFLPNMEAPGKTAKAVLDLSIVNSLITEYSNGFFAPLADCFLNGHPNNNNPPDTVALIQLDAGHDFLNIRAMAEKLIREFLFQSQQPLSKYLLIHRHILVPFLRKVTKNLGFLSKFFGSKPNESNILMEIMKKSKFGTRKTYFHSWADIDFKNNPLLGFQASPELYVRTQTDIVPGHMPFNSQDILSYLFPIAASLGGDPYITDISPVAKLLDATNRESPYVPVYNPVKFQGTEQDIAGQEGISKYNASIKEVKNAYSCLANINLKLTSIANGGGGAKYHFELEGPGVGVPKTIFTIEKTGDGKSFLGGQPFCHVLICLIISADYTATKNHNINKNPLDTEKITERTRLKTYLCNILLATNSLSNQFMHLENIINLWVNLLITTQEFIAIILMTKQLGDYGQASTWCIHGNTEYQVASDPHQLAVPFTNSDKQAIIHITGDKLCMASFAKKISECNSEITDHVGGYWANRKGCFIIYPKHNGFNQPQLISKLKMPSKVKKGLGGAQPDSQIKDMKQKKGNWKGGNDKTEELIDAAIQMIIQKYNSIIQTFSEQSVLTKEQLEQEIQNIKENIKRVVKDDYYYTAGFNEERLIEFSILCKDFREKLLYKIEACIHNITTIECIIEDKEELARADSRGNTTLLGGDKRGRETEGEEERRVQAKVIDKALVTERTKTMMQNLSYMSGLYYILQNVMLFWFTEVESLNLALSDTRETKLKTGEMDVDEEEEMDVDEEGEMDVIVKMEQELQNKNAEMVIKISDFVDRYNDTINKAKDAVSTMQPGGGQKKKNKDIEIKKCGKEKKVGAKEKLKEKLKKEKEKIKKEKEKQKEKQKEKLKKEKEKIKKEKEKQKEKLKKEKEKEKTKKEKLKEKLKKEKEKEKTKKEKLKEKKKETKQNNKKK